MLSGLAVAALLGSLVALFPGGEAQAQGAALALTPGTYVAETARFAQERRSFPGVAYQNPHVKLESARAEVVVGDDGGVVRAALSIRWEGLPQLPGCLLWREVTQASGSRADGTIQVLPLNSPEREVEVRFTMPVVATESYARGPNSGSVPCEPEREIRGRVTIMKLKPNGATTMQLCTPNPHPAGQSCLPQNILATLTNVAPPAAPSQAAPAQVAPAPSSAQATPGTGAAPAVAGDSDGADTEVGLQQMCEARVAGLGASAGEQTAENATRCAEDIDFMSLVLEEVVNSLVHQSIEDWSSGRPLTDDAKACHLSRVSGFVRVRLVRSWPEVDPRGLALVLNQQQLAAMLETCSLLHPFTTVPS